MIINMTIDMEQNLVFVEEELEYGTKKNKKISLNEFLQGYTSLIKEKEDNNKFLFFPPGTVEYRKNLNSCTFIVQTNPYKKYYELEDNEPDYLLIVKMNLDCNLVHKYICFKTQGPFNKRLSSFTKIVESEAAFYSKDETDAIKICLSKIKKVPLEENKISLSYKNIL